MPNQLLSPPEINLRSDRYLIARTVGACRRCRSSTLMVALVLPPGHEALELDDDAGVDAAQEDIWSVATQYAVLFHIEYLPDLVRRRLNGLTQSYRLAHSDAAGVHWANHCGRCGFLLDDQELFCEPGGAFLPTSEAGAGIIHLSAVDETIEAAAAGYAYEPAFFDAMGRG